MRRSAAPIWVSAIRNVPKLPNCPDDLCEAQYAALVLQALFSTYTFLTTENDEFEPIYPRSNLEELTSYVLQLEDPVDPAHSDGETWIQSKGGFQIARVKASILPRQYARRLELFLKNMAKDRTKELEALKSQRRDNIKQRLESAGWSKRDWLFRSEIPKDWVKLVEAPKLLTDRTWEGLYPTSGKVGI
ncbi:hypothetical protein FRC12_006777 [Ceratobasidium sp. 428]|nr:hypothetical protein FRC12_006777 [Ceratobasidium sp. 428]